MTRSVILGMALVVAAGSLGGCTDFRRALGLEKAPPDEFSVIQGAPLTLPPDFGLRPPHNTDKPAALSPMDQARVAVFRTGTPNGGAGTAPGAEAMTPGEQALLAKAGAGNADPRIRQQVDAETAQVADASNSFVDTLLFWKAAPVPGEPVNAPAEAKRVREDQTMGQPVNSNESNTPTVERTSRTVIDTGSL